ncbi:MAG: acyl-CoA desaturase [Myxococcota bacterium]
MATVTIVGPLLGTIAAIALAVHRGLSPVALALFASMFLFTSLGIEFGLHRYFAHRAFETKPGIALLAAIFGSMAAEGSVLYWAAGHRRHHAHSDTEGDPHSPHVRYGTGAMGTLRGLWHAHIGWMRSDRVTNCTLFARDIIKDPVLNRVHQLYIPIVLAGLLLPALIGGLASLSWMGALEGFLWGGLVRMFVVHHSTWSNASFAHVFGGRPFDAGDRSANNWWCAVQTFGASWQNNHHAFPSSAFLGFEWWQIDLAGYCIRLLSALGLVWDVKGRPSEEVMAKKRVSA